MTMARSTTHALAKQRNQLFRQEGYVDSGEALDYITSLENALRNMANMNVQYEAARIAEEGDLVEVLAPLLPAHPTNALLTIAKEIRDAGYRKEEA
jgi:hypothetical protein